MAAHPQAHRTAQPLPYRPDIDGLRAIAVLAVLGFHAFPAAVPGGFVGVDVFFVISGYLISGIILNDLQRGEFSFARFYARRIKRLFPALALVLAATLLFGWLALTPFEFRQLGLHTAAGAGFVSNFAFWHEAINYFGDAARFKPLLHLWSLGVEEQYYLLWPLLLFVARGPRTLGLIALIAVGSFACNLGSTFERDPLGAMFLPHTRFWELMLGGALAYGEQHGFGAAAGGDRSRNAAAAIGIALIAVSMVLLDETREFPGWRALLPTLGTVCLIWAGPDAAINRKVLSLRVIVYVGLISYALYLWHWPILAFIRILWDAAGAGAMALGLAASAVLAVLTYELVEKRIRFGRLRASGRPVAALICAVAVMGVAGVLVFSDRVQARSASDPFVRELSLAMRDWPRVRDGVIGGAGETVLLAGDSLMQQLLPRIDKATGESSHRTVIVNTRAGCLPIPGIERPRGARCGEFTESLFARAAQPDIRTVVIAGSWAGREDLRPIYFRVGDPARNVVPFSATQNTWVWDNLETAVRALATHGKRVILVLEDPRGSAFDPRAMARHSGLTFDIDRRDAITRSEATAFVALTNQRIKTLAHAAGAEWIDPADWFCSDLVCPTLDAQGRPIYRDAQHFRASFARDRLSALDAYVLR